MKISQALKGKRKQLGAARKSLGKRVERARGGLAIDRAVGKAAVANQLNKAGFKTKAKKVGGSAVRDTLRSGLTGNRLQGAASSIKKYQTLQSKLKRPR
jgi:hypothetical protein